MEGKVWENKSISNPINNPWLDWIVSGLKKFEGRINRKDWAKMRIGDTVIFVCDDSKVTVKIVSIHWYTNFGYAYLVHGKQLVPNAQTVDDATRTYSEIYHSNDDQIAIEENGVIILGIEVQ